MSCCTCYTHSSIQLLSGCMAAGLPVNCHDGQESGCQLCCHHQYSRTACPVSYCTCYTHSIFQLLSGCMAAGLSVSCHDGQESGCQLCCHHQCNCLSEYCRHNKGRHTSQQLPLKSSATGTRARVARVRAEYPDQLDYSGCWHSSC